MILEEFSRLPGIVRKAVEKVECFGGAESTHPGDPRVRLVEAVAALRRTLLRTLPKLLDCLIPPKRCKSHGKSLICQCHSLTCVSR